MAGPRESLIHAPLAAAGVPVARLGLTRGFGRPHEDALALRSVGALLRRHRFDLVHAHSAKAGVVGRLAARAAGVPVVYSPHCFPFVGPWGWRRRTFAVTVERALGRISDAIVCVADDERSVALEHGVAPAQRLHVVHNGVEDCAPGGSAGTELEAFAAGGPLAACVAVLRPQKAVHVFVDAAPRVLAALPGARLAVIGGGDLERELRARAGRLGLDPARFGFFPFQPPASRVLRLLDLFVLSSAWEAFPIGVLEALACGVPQVATDVGGTSEAVVDGVTGLLCPPGDPDALAERIVRLLGDPARLEAMARASRERHASRFRVGETVRRTAAVYAAATSRNVS